MAQNPPPPDDDGPESYASKLATLGEQPGGRSHAEAPRRRAYCPICAAAIVRDADGACHCEIGGPLPTRLGLRIFDALETAEAPRPPVHQPKLASNLWCPNCASELQDYRSGDVVHCMMCGLRMERPDARELADLRSGHRDPGRDVGSG